MHERSFPLSKHVAAQSRAAEAPQTPQLAVKPGKAASLLPAPPMRFQHMTRRQWSRCRDQETPSPGCPVAWKWLSACARARCRCWRRRGRCCTRGTAAARGPLARSWLEPPSCNCCPPVPHSPSSGPKLGLRKVWMHSDNSSQLGEQSRQRQGMEGHMSWHLSIGHASALFVCTLGDWHCQPNGAEHVGQTGSTNSCASRLMRILARKSRCTATCSMVALSSRTTSTLGGVETYFEPCRCLWSRTG